MNRLDSYSPLGYSLAGVVRRGRERGGGVHRRSTRGLCRERIRPPRRDQLGTDQSLRGRPRRRLAPAGRVRHGGFDRLARRSSRKRPNRRHRVCHRPRTWSASLSCNCSWPPAFKWSDWTQTRNDAGWQRRPALFCARHLTTTDRWRWSRRCSKPRADLVPTVFSSLPEAPPTNRSSWRHASHTTGQRSSTSVKCKLDLPWNDYYEKELDLRFSRSYGPGRYDPKYEIEGVDYPAGYVRWTERRNLHCFVNAVARKEVDPEPLIAGIFPLRMRRACTSSSATAYCRVSASSSSTTSRRRPITTSTDRTSESKRPQRPPDACARASLADSPSVATNKSSVRVGFIGAGNYASSMLLPHLAKRTGDRTRPGVATRRSLSAVNAQRKFGFARCRNQYGSRLRGPDDRRRVHRYPAQCPCRADMPALEAGKAVFVEKPLGSHI